jgi:hypothetical protein
VSIKNFYFGAFAFFHFLIGEHLFGAFGEQFLKSICIQKTNGKWNNYSVFRLKIICKILFKKPSPNAPNRCNTSGF